MSNNETCIHGGIIAFDILNRLHENQGGTGRHKCTNCAYEHGFSLGSKNRWASYEEYCVTIENAENCPEESTAPKSILKGLGQNQGGTGRHKCTNCAFKKGFETGIQEVRIGETELTLVPTPKAEEFNEQNSQNTISKVDFIEREIKNKKLGDLGELFVLQNEIRLLNEVGRTDLAEQVRHVSKEDGDGIGFDILSYNSDGDKKMIEVKTTRGNKTRSFYITPNELECSAKNENCYYLYRLFDFETRENKGSYYKIQGNLNQLLLLKPISFIAKPI